MLQSARCQHDGNPAKSRSPWQAALSATGSGTFRMLQRTIRTDPDQQCLSIFVSMPLSIPSTRAAAPCPSSRSCSRPAARRWCSCATSSSDTRAMVETARAIKAALAPFGVPLLINDRVDVALAAGADGVHVGQTDMAAEDARRLLGRDAIIGLSIKTGGAGGGRADRVSRLCRRSAASTPPPRRTNPSRRSASTGSRRIVDVFRRRDPKFPTCAIAGINAANAGATIAAGADGVSVISALSLAPDPTAAAKAMRAVVDEALAARQAAMTRRSPSPSPARIPAAAPASRPTSRPSPRSASTARASSPR